MCAPLGNSVLSGLVFLALVTSTHEGLSGEAGPAYPREPWRDRLAIAPAGGEYPTFSHPYSAILV